MAFSWIIFNPISLIGGFTNLGSFNDALFYLLVLWPILDESPTLRNPIFMGLLNAVVTYFDPRLIFLMIPFSVLQARYHIGLVREKFNPFKETMIRLTISYVPIILTILCMSNSQFKNLKNILLVNNPAENLGNFWYLMHEMFLDRLVFFKYIYLIMMCSACIFVSLQVYKCADMIDLVQYAKGKTQMFRHEQVDHIERGYRRHQRLYMSGVLVISFVKFIMNPYPNLHDISFIIFFTIMSMPMVLNYVEGFYFNSAATLYAIITTSFLWITWLKRFSGNANYFYFQVIALNAFIVLIYLQVFIAVDQKRKKYARELSALT